MSVYGPVPALLADQLLRMTTWRLQEQRPRQRGGSTAAQPGCAAADIPGPVPDPLVRPAVLLTHT